MAVSGAVSYDYVLKNLIISDDSEPVIVDEREAVEFVEREPAPHRLQRLKEQGLIKNESIFRSCQGQWV